MKNITFLLILLIHQGVFCQSQPQELIEKTDENTSKITSVLENYFDLEREAIHVHLCKTTFLTNESIWYQGYVINRKTNKPFFTTNVFVMLFDEKGKKLSEKLIFASNGGFSGKIALDKSFHSGIYYLQAYTNWMNNFGENESTIEKLVIVNPLEGKKDYTKINSQSLEILLTPEGGNLIAGISNNIGIQVKDCRGNAPKNGEATLQNERGEILKTIPLSPFGFGKVEYIPSGKNDKIVIDYDNTKIEKQLPLAKPIGFAMNVNNYSILGKTIINIKTNPLTQKNLSGKKLYLLIHQDQKSSINEISFKETSLEQIFTYASNTLSSGINFLRIIDSDLNEYACRPIYIYPKIGKGITLKKNNRNYDQINLIGYSSYPNAILSASILPQASESIDDGNNIFAGLTVNPYLEQPLLNANYYFQHPTKTIAYALDLALLNQSKSKYSWNLMKVNKPVMNYSFDIGLNVKGTISPSIKNKTFHKTKLVSKKDLILLNADITEQGEYSFGHVLVPDSTCVQISLLKLPDFEQINSVLTPQVHNRKRPFYKEFKITIDGQCDPVLESFDVDNFNTEFRGKIIRLKEVVIEQEAPRLRYERIIGNANLVGYKIEGSLKHQTLIRFIEYNGFFVKEENGNVEIYSRLITTLHAARATPAIFIDGRQITSTIEVQQLLMDDIDEIFLSPHAIVPNMGNFQGVIKIYTKRIGPLPYNPKKNPNDFFITEGFSKYEHFKNANYDNLGPLGFRNFGLLEWSPRTLTNKEGDFKINLTDYNHNKAKTIIQGMTAEGILFQEEMDIELR